MLKSMRNSFQHLKWVLVFIVFMFVLLIFVDWGAGGANQGGGSQQSSYLARVNGEVIGIDEYQRAIVFAEQNLEQNYGQQLTPEMRAMFQIPQQVATGLVERALLLQEAREMDLDATPEEIRKSILEIPALNPEGKFVGEELYRRYVTTGFNYPTVAAFEEDIARDVTLAKLESALQSSVVLSPQAIEAEYRKQNENAKIRYILLPAAGSLGGVTVTPEEVTAYYNQNKTRFSHPEQRRVKYFMADVNRVRTQVRIDEATLRAQYEKEKESYKAGEQARVSHILIKPADTTPAADAAAKQKADALAAQLRAGGDFAQLARQNSADPGSAANGGDIGLISRGQTVGPFDEVSFTAPIGQISNPVKTGFGYHIIKVVERTQGGYKPFEQVRGEIEQRLGGERAKTQARDEIARLKIRLDQIKEKTEAALRPLASDLVAFNDSGWIGKTQAVPGLGEVTQLNTWMESAKAGEVGEIIETPRGPMVPVFEGTRPAGVSSLEEVRAQVESDVRLVKAREAASRRLAGALGGGLDSAAAQLTLTPEEATITRGGFIPNFTGNVTPLIDAAFAANPGEVKGPVIVDQGAVAFQVIEQKKFDPAQFAQQKGTIADQLRQQEARKLRASLVSRLRKNSDIEMNDALIAQMAPPPARPTQGM